jgi:hypothetical protein
VRRLVLVVVSAGCGFQSPAATILDGGDAAIDGVPDSPLPDASPSVRLEATGDAYFRQFVPDEIQPMGGDLRTGSGADIGRANRSIIQFSLAALPVECSIRSARLHLYYFEDAFMNRSVVFTVHRVSAAWTPVEVTWNRRNSTTPWTTPGGDFHPTAEASVTVTPGAFGWLTWDLTVLTAAWASGAVPNHGVEIIEPNDGAANEGRKELYSSRFATVMLRPNLTVECE